MQILISAAIRGNYEIVKLLLENGANVHANNDCLIHECIQRGKYQVAKLLLDNGANISADDDILLRQQQNIAV